MAEPMTRLTLVPHRQTLKSPINTVTAEICLDKSKAAQIRFVVTGGIGRLRLPAAAPSAHADNLWRETCFEAFIAPCAETNYFELNFSPSTQWAAYRFSSYRQGMDRAAECPAPEIAVKKSTIRFELRARIGLDWIKPPAPWKIGLSTILMDVSGEISYWALAHSAGKPDFHDRSSFVHVLNEKAGS